MVARSARRHIRPLFLDIPGLRRWKWLAYDLPGTIITALMVGYSMVPFTLKEMRASLVVWGSVGYCMRKCGGYRREENLFGG